MRSRKRRKICVFESSRFQLICFVELYAPPSELFVDPSIQMNDIYHSISYHIDHPINPSLEQSTTSEYNVITVELLNHEALTFFSSLEKKSSDFNLA